MHIQQQVAQLGQLDGSEWKCTSGMGLKQGPACSPTGLLVFVLQHSTSNTVHVDGDCYVVQAELQELQHLLNQYKLAYDASVGKQWGEDNFFDISSSSIALLLQMHCVAVLATLLRT